MTPTTEPGAGAPAGPPGPLSGLLVADFSRILAGPYATMILADLGAEVVKVEGPGGDDTRSWMPPTRDDVSTYYLGINRGKRSVALDLRDEGDAAIARELAARADVLIENVKPGGLGKYGLDHDSVREANPGVVYSSISGFGSGRGREVPGYDLMVQAISGLMSLTGDPDGPPYRAGISVFDVMAGNHAVVNLGSSAGETSPLDSSTLRSRSLRVLGYTNAELTCEQRRESVVEIAALAARGDLAVAHETAPLADAEAAWRRHVQGAAHGRVVLVPRSPASPPRCDDAHVA